MPLLLYEYRRCCSTALAGSLYSTSSLHTARVYQVCASTSMAAPPAHDVHTCPQHMWWAQIVQVKRGWGHIYISHHNNVYESNNAQLNVCII